jgi:XTP/dITP diphosphohydrolase
MLKTKLLLATNNKGKLEELRQLFSVIPFDLISPSDIGLNLDVHESGKTYATNARLKARAFADASGLLTLADDSGLEVDALNLEPGVRSSRYSGGGAAENNALLLKKLSGVPEGKRTARFRCAVALCVPGRPPILADGKVEGRIGFVGKGEKGFGYDPLFIPDGFTVTFAEMSDAEKNALSHRGNALKNLLEKIRKM